MAVVTRYGSAYSFGTGQIWNNPTNIYADDGAYVDTPGARSENWILMVSGFGFSIPVGSTINSVVFEMEYKLSTIDSAATITLGSYKNLSVMGTTWSSTDEPLTDTLVQKTDNGSWTAEDLNDNPQARIAVLRTSNKACTYYFDHVRIIVDYTESSYDKSGTVAITNSVAVTVNGKKAASRSAEITGAASAESTGKKNSTNAFIITGSDTVTVEGKQTISKFGSVSITTTSIAETAGKADRAGVVDIIASSSLDTAGKSARTGVADITAALSVTAEAKKAATDQTDITGTTKAEASGRKGTTGQAGIEAAASPTADGAKSTSRAISIAATPIITVYGTGAAGSIDKTGVTEITATTTINVTGTKAVVGSVSLSIAGQMSTVGTKRVQADANISCTAGLALVGEKEVVGMAGAIVSAGILVVAQKSTFWAFSILSQSDLNVDGQMIITPNVLKNKIVAVITRIQSHECFTYREVVNAAVIDMEKILTPVITQRWSQLAVIEKTMEITATLRGDKI